MLNGPWKDTFLINIYKHDKSNIQNFTNWLENTFITLKTLFKNHKCIIAGDFNEDMGDFGQTPIAVCLETNGYTQNIRKPTRVTETSKTRLDNIFTNFQSKGIVTNPGLSDHHACAIFQESGKQKIEPIRSNSTSIKRRQWTKKEVINLKAFLNSKISECFTLK